MAGMQGLRRAQSSTATSGEQKPLKARTLREKTGLKMHWILLASILSTLVSLSQEAPNFRRHGARNIGDAGTGQNAGSSALSSRSASSNSSVYPTRFANTTWDNENWRITTTDLDQGHYQSRMSLANGYLGVNVAAVGPFFDIDVSVDGDDIEGWPLFTRRQSFAGIAGFYDSQPSTNGSNFPWLDQYGGDSVVSGIPHWGGLVVEMPNGQVLNASVEKSTISNFSSTLDIRNALMTWSFVWTPIGSGGLSLDIQYSLFLHKLSVNQGFVQLTITPSNDTNVTIADVLDGTAAVRTVFVDKAHEQNSSTIWTAVRPVGISNITAYVYSTMSSMNGTIDMSSRNRLTGAPYIGTNDSSIAQAVSASLKAGQTTVMEKYVGIASTDAFVNPQMVARNASQSAMTAGFSQSLSTHAQEWTSILTPDSVDDFSFPENGTLPSDPNVIDLAILAVTNAFHLLQNTVGANATTAAGNAPINSNSIPVAGLASDSYGGQVFWDSETWMAPGLVVAHPQAAQQIANYRVAKYPQAQRNLATAFTSSKNQSGRFSPEGAVFPWTSARFGNCTATGPCFDYEYHINGDIATELLNYWIVTGDGQFFKSQLFPVYNSIAIFYSDLLEKNASTGQWAVTNVTDPDEYANFVDNGGYTQALISTTLNNANTLRKMFNISSNQTFTLQTSDIDLPMNDHADIILEYTGMNGSINVKQADVVLIDYPLAYPNNYTLNDLDYYAGKQSLNGPGMTYGVFGIIANGISPAGCSSYTYDLYASQPYARGPWYQFSEQLVDDYTANGGTHPAFPFLTGMGGHHQVSVFGYLGLRLRIDGISIDPALPPQIPQLRYRTIYYQGWPISAFSNQNHTTLTRLSSPLPNANGTFAASAIPIQIGTQNTTTLTLQLHANASTTIANRQPSTQQTVPGNLAQCAAVVTSPDAYEAGQFPLAAVDGAGSTKWQPTLSNVSTSITIDLASASAQHQQQAYKPISGLFFDWAQTPPVSYAVVFHNSSSSSSSSSSSTAAAVNVSSSSNITISAPLNAARANANAIVPYTSNTTNVSLVPPVWSGRYVTLTIAGNQAYPRSRNASGATVAEFALVGA